MIDFYELNQDAYSYFLWENKSSNDPNLNVFNIHSISPLDFETSKNFIIEASKSTKSLLYELSNQHSGFSLYLFVPLILDIQHTKVDLYKKVWKKVKDNFSLENYILGPEISSKIGKFNSFSSILKFELKEINDVLNIVSNDPLSFFIIASKKNLLTEDYVNYIHNVAFPSNSDFHLDFENLATNLCNSSEHILFRWGDSSEESMLSLIFNNVYLSFFKQQYEKFNLDKGNKG